MPAIKRLTLYPKKLAAKESEAAGAKKKRRWRWIPTREKPQLKVPKKLPNFRELPPKYEQPAMSAEEAEKIAGDKREEAVKNDPIYKGISACLTLFFIFLVVIFVIMMMQNYIPTTDNQGSGISGCPTSCGGFGGSTVAPQCSCPSDCPYYFTITNPPSMRGYKQCSDRPIR